MMKKKSSHKLWHFFMWSFLVFTLIFVVLLWLGMTIFLDDAYRGIKFFESWTLMRSIERDAAAEGRIDLTVLDERYDTRAYLLNSDGKIVESSTNGVIQRPVSAWMQDSLRELYSRLRKEGGHMKFYLEEQDFRDISEGASLDSVINNQFEKPTRLLELRMIHMSSGDYMLLLMTQLFPVRLTTNSIYLILAIGTMAFILLALIFSTTLSKRIARPIEKINRGAKRIAAGDYSVTFEKKGLEEIAELSETLDYTARELQMTDKLRREIIANVSHDLRTPLTMIRGYAEVMRDLPGENSSENLQIIIDETDRLSALISDILYVSRLQSEQEKPKKSVYSLSGSIRSVIYRIGKLKKSEGYDIRFEDAGREVYILADEQEMDRVLYNLIGNALDFTGEDRLVEVSESVSTEKEGSFVTVRVTDHGQGIPKEELGRVWERYYKGSRESDEQRISTGLGLSIVKNILDLHGAAYGVESELNKGSSFWFRMPVTGPQNFYEAAQEE